MTNEQVTKARKLRDEGATYRAISVIFGISETSIRRYLNPEEREHDRVVGVEYDKTHRKERRQYLTKWRKAHKEVVQGYDAKYNRIHKEERHRSYAKYYEKNKGQIRIAKVGRRKAHNEEARRHDAAYYKANRKRICLRKAIYRRIHPSEYIAHNAARKAMILGVTVGNFAEIKEIYCRAREDVKIRCYLCGKLIPKGHRHVDHITPLSKGGAHRASNLAVACDSCNMGKHNKLPQEVGILL